MKICKHCFNSVEETTGVSTNTPPKEGDFGICISCGTISTFDKDMNLIPYPLEKIKLLKETYPKIYNILQQASIHIKSNIIKN